MTWPHPWHPDIVDVQIATIGSLSIVAVPGEFTYVFLVPLITAESNPIVERESRLKIVPHIHDSSAGTTYIYPLHRVACMLSSLVPWRFPFSSPLYK